MEDHLRGPTVLFYDAVDTCHNPNVRNIKPAPNTQFVETALRRCKESVAKKPPISLASIGALLTSAGRAFPLVAVYRERRDPEGCQIGEVRGVGRTHLDLHEIGPDAKWDATPTAYRLNEITRVAFGGDYEDALVLVGGKAPKQLRRAKPVKGQVAVARRMSKSGRTRPK